MNFKPIKADDTEKKFKEKYYGPAKKIKYKPKKHRANVPPLEMAWLKTKAYFRNKAEDFKWYLDSKVDVAIGGIVKPVVWMVIGLLIVFVLIKIL